MKTCISVADESETGNLRLGAESKREASLPALLLYVVTFQRAIPVLAWPALW